MQCCLSGVQQLSSFRRSQRRSQQSAVKVKVRSHQTLPKFYEIVSPLHCCAYATGCREDISFDSPSVRGKLVQAAGSWYFLCCGSCCQHTVLLHKLDTKEYRCLVLPRTLTNRRHRFLRFLRAAQLPSQDTGLRLQPCFACNVQSPRALQLFSAAVSPHTGRCAGWLAAHVRTRAFIERFAHSNVASLNTSSHASQLLTQPVQFVSPARGTETVHGGVHIMITVTVLLPEGGWGATSTQPPDVNKVRTQLLAKTTVSL